MFLIFSTAAGVATTTTAAEIILPKRHSTLVFVFVSGFSSVNATGGKVHATCWYGALASYVTLHTGDFKRLH